MKAITIILVLLAMLALGFNRTGYTICYLWSKAKRWLRWKIKINFQRRESMKTRCLCGVIIKNDGKNSNSESTGYCDICAKMMRDVRWYRRNKLNGIADHIQATLRARELKAREK